MSDSFTKDPADVLDYLIDFTEWLATDGDTITAHSITIPTGLTLDNSIQSSTGITVWLSGGSVGTHYDVDCLITTTVGRQKSKILPILVIDQ